MDGDDPHQVFIAFQPQLLFLVPVGRDAAAVAEPLEQTHHAGMGSAGDLQQFGQVQQIGQTPLAVTESQQPLRDFLAGQPSAKKAHETVLAPQQPIVLKLFQPCRPGLFRLAQAMQILAAQAE